MPFFGERGHHLKHNIQEAICYGNKICILFQKVFLDHGLFNWRLSWNRNRFFFGGANYKFVYGLKKLKRLSTPKLLC